MQNINASSYSYNDFNFSMQTSSGDKIDLKLYDEKNSALSYEKDKNTTIAMLSLSHSYGYSFSYEGNGIDTNDALEIAQAMEMIKPILEEYFDNIKEPKSNAEVINKAFDINTYLPKSQDLTTKNYLNDQTLKNIDKILEKTQNQNEKILKEAQKLFDALIKQSERFELYM
ncbi:MAG: hypothetical protein IBX44_02230 [Sulfurospirillum sp.]|nr:hypothetical protein [Sulfurospirillum sp.]